MTIAADIHVKGLGSQEYGELTRKAKQLGLTPGGYVKRLVQEDLAISQAAKEKSFKEILGPGRAADEDELDALVDRLRTEHHEKRSRKRK